jgi:benzoyl-CoA reductase subunit C
MGGRFPFEDLADRWSDLSFGEVRRWRDRHPDGKVIGTFPVWVPTEIIHAAGALPVALYGGGTLIDIEHADARMQSFICSIARSTLELGLRGYLETLDGMVFPSICDVARNLSGVWARNFPRQWVFYIHLPENPESRHAVPYMVAELRRLVQGLEALTGRPVSSEALWRSIELYEENRRLIQTLYRIKAEEPDRLSTCETYVLVRAGAQVPVEEHNRLLTEALGDIQARTIHRRRDRVRVLLEGSFCEQPPLDFLWVLEEAGCAILDDDLLLGRRFLETTVPRGGDPLEALAVAYLRSGRSTAVRYEGPNRRVETFLDRVRRLRVDGVIFAYAKFCDPAQFDYVVLKEHLERAGVPYLVLEFEEKMTTFEVIQNQVETFVESILFYT